MLEEFGSDSYTYMISDQIESNETLREELDDIVGGLQTYLATVQTKAQKKEKEFDQLLKENESMQERMRGLESELGVMDSEARNYSAMEKVRLRMLYLRVDRCKKKKNHYENILMFVHIHPCIPLHKMGYQENIFLISLR